MMNKDKTPTAAEMEILSLLWEKAPQTVKEIHDQLKDKRDTGYTTTLKIMQVMVTKGFLTRNLDNKSHLYYPALEQGKTRGKILDSLLDNAFGGSAAKLVMQVLGNHQASREELDKIKAFIEQIEKK
jgi:predicted transcriptional regulator